MMIKKERLTSSAITANFEAHLSEVTHTRGVMSLMRSESSNQIINCKEIYCQLYDLFMRQSDQLCSGGTITTNGTVQVSTQTGATLTSENVINGFEIERQSKF